MSVTLPVDVYEVFETEFGKERAKEVIKAFEKVISDTIDYRWSKTKEELLEAIRKEFITKDVFEEKINTLRAELLGRIEALYEKTEKDKAELLGRIEALYEKTEKDKAELLGKIEALYEKTEKDKAELLGKMERDKEELLGRIEKNRTELESKIARLDQKFNFMMVLLVLALTVMNPVVAEILKKILKLG